MLLQELGSQEAGRQGRQKGIKRNVSAKKQEQDKDEKAHEKQRRRLHEHASRGQGILSSPTND
jgi:hypothetical protein